MFLGTHEPKLDEKGRIILPARFRDELSNGLVVTKGQERCLYVFPSKEFTSITERLRQAPVTEKAARHRLLHVAQYGKSLGDGGECHVG